MSGLDHGNKYTLAHQVRTHGKPKPHARCQKVILHDPKTKEKVREYPTILAASADLGISKHSVRDYCQENRNMPPESGDCIERKNFIFKFEEKFLF